MIAVTSNTSSNGVVAIDVYWLNPCAAFLDFRGQQKSRAVRQLEDHMLLIPVQVFGETAFIVR